MSNLPKKVTYNSDTKKIELHFETAATQEELLSAGVELTIYKEEGTLKGELKTDTANDFATTPVYAKILFKDINSTGDIKGGLAATSTQLKIKNHDAPYIDIATPDKFVLGIIGVDDIRAHNSGPKYNQIYLLDERRIFLETEVNGTETTLTVKFKKKA